MRFLNQEQSNISQSLNHISSPCPFLLEGYVMNSWTLHVQKGFFFVHHRRTLKLSQGSLYKLHAASLPFWEKRSLYSQMFYNPLECKHGSKFPLPVKSKHVVPPNGQGEEDHWRVNGFRKWRHSMSISFAQVPNHAETWTYSWSIFPPIILMGYRNNASLSPGITVRNI